MAAAVVDATTTSTSHHYPRLYPILHDSPAQLFPGEAQGEEREEGEEVRNGGEEEEEQRGGGGGGGSGEGEERLQTSGHQQVDGACLHSPPNLPVSSPSQASSVEGSPDSRETTATASHSEQTTTNGEGTMTDSALSPKILTPDGTLQTGDTVDGNRLAQREDYVDRVWEEFVTHFLLGSCHIQKAAIFDLATRRPLAMNGNLRVSPEEMEQLVTSLHYIQLAYRNGVTLEGKTYKVRLADGRNGILARTGREGCTVCKTHTLVIVGVHDENGSSRKCNEDVMRLGDFFRKKAV